MPNESATPERSQIRSPVRGGSFLGLLAPAERVVVLDRLLASHRDLMAEAEKAPHELLESVAVEEVADEVSRALTDIRLEDLGARAGRVRSRGWVHETDAPWLGVEIPDDAPGSWWPPWTDLV